MAMNPGVSVIGVADEFSDWFGFVCTATVPTTVYAEMSGRGPRSVLAAVTVCAVVGLDGDGVGESRSTQRRKPFHPTPIDPSCGSVVPR